MTCRTMKSVLTRLSQPVRPRDPSARSSARPGGLEQGRRPPRWGRVGSTDGRRVHALQRRARALGHLRRGRRGVRVPRRRRRPGSCSRSDRRSPTREAPGRAPAARSIWARRPSRGRCVKRSEEVGAIPGEARRRRRVPVRPGDRLDVHHRGRRSGRAVRRFDQLRDRRRRWFTFDEVDALPLHAGFAAAWPHVRAIIDRACRSSRRSIDDDTRTVNGTCHHDCPDSCGWTATVDDPRGDGRRAAGRTRRGEAARQRRPPVLGR